MKKQIRILEEMIKEVSKDALIAVATPLIGLFNKDTKYKIYEHLKGEDNARDWVEASTLISIIPALLTYGTATYEVYQHTEKFDAVTRGFFYIPIAMYAIIETALRIDSEVGASEMGSIVGYIPGKVVGYLMDKYKSVNDKVNAQE